MKTLLITRRVFASFAVCLFIAGCGGPEVEPTPTPKPTPEPEPKPTTIAVSGVSLSKTSMTLVEGDSETISATVSPSNATNQSISWSSSPSDVASVDGGKVTALKPGKATVTVTTADGGKTATCSVTVEAKMIPVTGVTLDKTEAELVEGESITLTATIAPEDATDKTVSWVSSDEEIAKVDSEGKVSAIAPGTADITVTTTDGEKKAVFALTVVAKVVPVESIAIDKETLELVEGDSATLTATVSPDNASDKTYAWTSSNPDVATVAEDGTVTAIAPGNTTITATSNDGGKTASCEVSVAKRVIPVESVTLSGETSVTAGDTVTFTYTITPSDATVQDVKWSSSDESVIKVDADGTAVVLKNGVATITVTTVDGEKTASAKILASPLLVSSLSLDVTSLTLAAGEEGKLVATVAPENATNKELSWKSLSTSVATVDAEGNVKAVKPGTAKIRVSTTDGSKLNAECEVTVTKAKVAVTGVSLDNTLLLISVGESRKLSATVKPSGATNKEVSWASSNESVATVDSNGNVKGLKEGSATITVTTKDGSKTATCKVTVSKPVSTIAVTGVSLNKTSLSLTVGESQSLSATVSPSNASDKSVSWKSSDTSVATVDGSGNVKAVKAGTATITVTTKDGSKTATCKVTVSKPVSTIAVTGVSLNKTSLSLTVGESQSLSATVSPSNASDKSVSWKSSNTSVATVDGSGNVKAVKAGTAKVTVTTKDGSKTATCNVTVKSSSVAVTSISLNKKDLYLSEGESEKLIVTFNPSDATNKEVTWESDTPSKATVDNNGNVKAVKAGTATITVTTKDGSRIARCLVHVSAAVINVTGVSVSPTSVTLAEGERKELTATVKPSNATKKSVTWTSSNTTVATVSTSGLVTAKSAGTATITVTTVDGSYTAKCTVTVKKKVTPEYVVLYHKGDSYGNLSTGTEVKSTMEYTMGSLANNNLYFTVYDKANGIMKGGGPLTISGNATIVDNTAISRNGNYPQELRVLSKGKTTVTFSIYLDNKYTIVKTELTVK